MNDFAIGDTVLVISRWGTRKCTIARETKTFWILDDDSRFRKQDHQAPGQNAFGCDRIQEFDETTWRKELSTRRRNWLRKFPWEDIDDCQVDRVVVILKEFLNGCGRGTGK